MSGEAQEAEPITLDDLESLALGRIGLRPSDFGEMTPREFFNCVSGWTEEKAESEERELKRLRWMGALVLNKGRKKIHQVKPENLIPLNGDSYEGKGYTVEERKAIEERFKKASNG